MPGRPPPIEISDLLIELDGDQRRPVSRSALLARLAAGGHRRAVRVVASLPAPGDVLDPDAVDALLVRVHLELQRLSEELQQPHRLLDVVRPWLDDLLAAPGPVALLDVGCGLGYSLRWLAARARLDPRVRLVGVDLNPALVEHARGLAAAESLTCRFEVADLTRTPLARVTGVPAGRTVVTSSGLLHHLDRTAVAGLLRGHEGEGVAGFAHFDPVPGRWSVLGAWVFHRARMREPLSRHDGVDSIRRAWPASALLGIAGEAAPSYALTCTDPRPGWPAVREVLRPLAGRRVAGGAVQG